MNSFSDRDGKKWVVNLNLGAAMRVKSICDVNLLELISLDGENGADTSQLENLISNPYSFINVLHIMCSGRDGNDNIDIQDFADKFDATSIDAAVDCLIREIIDFSQPAKRKLLTLLYNKTRDYQEQMTKKVGEIVESEKFNKELDAQLSELLTNLPE